jgi:CHASE2 domain-containing sensor protein
VAICYLLFLQAGWIPVVPPALALIISGTSVVLIMSVRLFWAKGN